MLNNNRKLHVCHQIPTIFGEKKRMEARTTNEQTERFPAAGEHKRRKLIASRKRSIFPFSARRGSIQGINRRNGGEKVVVSAQEVLS